MILCVVVRSLSQPSGAGGEGQVREINANYLQGDKGQVVPTEYNTREVESSEMLTK